MVTEHSYNEIHSNNPHIIRMDSSNIRQVANCRSLDSAIYANIKTMQNEIKTARPDLITYTAGQTVCVFKAGQETTLKCVPINAEVNLWLCSTQNRNAVTTNHLGRLTSEKVFKNINQIFPNN